MKRFLSVPILLLFITLSYSQTDKVIFVKDTPSVLQSASSYSFLVGYEATEERDLAIELFGGPEKFWAGKTISVSKGIGIIELDFSSSKKIPEGDNYTMFVSIRERGGDWRTGKASSAIKNLRIIDNKKPEILDNASFSQETPLNISTSDLIQFNINYIASEEQLIQIAIYKKNQWYAASKPVKVSKGNGVKKIPVYMDPPSEGKDYKFVLLFGNGPDFPNKFLISKEISGVHISKPKNLLTVKELRKKSTRIRIEKNAKILTLPGDPVFKLIQIITQKGLIVKEAVNTNTISISDLPKGLYFATTDKKDFYQFIKN